MLVYVWAMMTNIQRGNFYSHPYKVKHITASSVLMQCISSVAYLWQAKHDKSGLSLKSAPIEFQSSICEIRKSLYENWKSLYEN